MKKYRNLKFRNTRNYGVIDIKKNIIINLILIDNFLYEN